MTGNEAPAGSPRVRLGALDVFRGLAILAVLVVHVTGHVLPSTAEPSAAWLALAAANRALQFAVHAFLFLSAFLGGRALLGDRSGATYVQRRLPAILVPYVLWSLVYLVLQYRGDLAALNVVVIAQALATGKASFHLYYLVVAVQLYLLVPLAAPLFRRRLPFWLAFAVTAVIQAGVFLLNRSVFTVPSPGSIVFWYLPSVVMGLWLASLGDDWRQWTRRHALIAAIVCAVGLAAFMPQGLALLRGRPVNTAVYQAALWVYASAMNIVLLRMSLAWPSRAGARWVARLGKRSMAVYLAHPLFLMLADRLTRGCAPPPWVRVAFCFAACLAGPLLLMSAVSMFRLDRLAWGVEPPPAILDRPLRLRRWVAGTAIPLAAMGCFLLNARSSQSRDVSPVEDTLYTSMKHVTGMAAAPDGTVWAATTGGILRRSPSGAWTKFTRMQGLPSQAALGIHVHAGDVLARIPEGIIAFRNGVWQLVETDAAPPDGPAFHTAAAVWRGQSYVATRKGLRRKSGRHWSDIPLPPSSGSYVSALLAGRDGLWAALAGDGVWSFNGRRWRRVEIGIPQAARNITALATAAGVLWVGTEDSGIWQYRSGCWVHHEDLNEPASGDIRAVAAYNHRLYVSTGSDGISILAAGGWSRVSAPELTTDSPRQLVVFKTALFARHANGVVDRLDRGVWKRNVWPWLPGGKALGLAVDGAELLVAERGGWSRFNGKTWRHCRNVKALENVPVTAIFAEGAAVWIGTARGLFLFEDDASSAMVAGPEPSGYITGIRRSGGTLYAGTRSGLWIDGSNGWKLAPSSAGKCIRALAPASDGGVLAAMEDGVWRFTPSAAGPVRAPMPRAAIDAQTVCATPGGVWIGTTSGLDFIRSTPPSRLALAAPGEAQP